MKRRTITYLCATALMSISMISSLSVKGEESTHDNVHKENELQFLQYNQDPLLKIPDTIPKKLTYDSGVDIPYPKDGVKGIYVTGNTAAGPQFDKLTTLLNDTELNSMVIDVKDDYGNILLDFESQNELIQAHTHPTFDAKETMNQLEENNIFPIARIVVFKDTELAKDRPDLSFTQSNGNVWSNSGGESFVNPYEKEVWEYNVEVAKEAAKLGFKDIQFDYVRFPEGFENIDEQVNYTRGHYDNNTETSIRQRVDAVTDFVTYAHNELKPFGVDVSVDIFGYAVTMEETPGIGQNFFRIAENVDVISSMIYPSHWGPGALDVDKPDTQPYQVIKNYMDLENKLLDKLGDDAPISRPWIQDFTASYLGSGMYIPYSAHEVSEQVRALNDSGVNEFLLWNASNTYSEGATYSFE